MDETHEVIHTVKVSKLSAYGLFALCVASIIGFVYAILVFTPLRFSIPGYPDAHFRRDAIANAIKIDSLETSLKRWELYSESIMRVLSNEENINIDEILKGGRRLSTTVSEESLHYRDSALRAKVQKEEQFSISSNSRKTGVLEGMYFFTPLKGVVSNGFNRATHPAIDITAPAGSVVKAALDGTVIYAGWSDEYGYTIQIQHSGDIITGYKHNSRLLKNIGDKVTAGTPIAYMGNTGSLTTGDHLHFEIWHEGEPLDPAEHMSF